MPRVLACPTCNAALPDGDPGTHVTCGFCANKVELPGQREASRGEGWPSGVTVLTSIEWSSSTATPATAAASRAGCGITVAVLLAVLAIVGVGVWSADEGRSSRLGGGPAPVVVFGTEGTGVGQFDDAREVAVDAEGFVYVGEFGSARIQRFTRSGEVSGQWIVDSDQRVPLTGLSAARDGTVIAQIGFDVHRYRGPAGDALGPVVIDPDAILEFFSAAAPLPDGGLLVYQTDGPTRRFRWLGIDGQVTREVTPPELLIHDRIDRMVVDGQGTIYALGLRRVDASGPVPGVYVFDRDGTFRTFFGGRGDEPGQFRLTLGLAVDGRSRVAVSGLGGVQLFDATGRYLDRIDVGPTAYGVAFDHEGLLWVSTGEEVRAYEVPGD